MADNLGVEGLRLEVGGGPGVGLLDPDQPLRGGVEADVINTVAITDGGRGQVCSWSCWQWKFPETVLSKI